MPCDAMLRNVWVCVFARVFQALRARAGAFSPVLPLDSRGNTWAELVDAWRLAGFEWCESFPWPPLELVSCDETHLTRYGCDCMVPAWREWLASQVKPGLKVLLICDSSLTSHNYPDVAAALGGA